MDYFFGDFALAPETRELTRNGAPIAVEPQVFDLIVFLIEERGRVVSKDEIIAAVWDGRFVSDSAVSSRIKSARQALGDDGRAQAVIKTIHGKGFRFVANLRAGPDEPPEAAAAPPVDAPAAPSVTDAPNLSASRAFGPVQSLRAAILVSVVALLAAGAVAALLLGRAAPASAGETRIAVLPVENATAISDYDWVELGLLSLVVHSLENRAGQNVVSPRAVMALAPAGAVPESGSIDVDPDLIAKLQRAYGASHVVAARLIGAAEELTLEYRVISPRGISSQRATVGDDPTTLAGRMAREVLSTLPRSGERDASLRAVSEDPFVSEAYARGRALQLQGRAEESRDLFKVAAEQDPENIWLRYEYALSTRMMGEIDESEALLDALLIEAETRNEATAALAVHNGLGRIYAYRRDNDAAIAAYEKALAIGERLGDHKRVGAVLTNLGIEERIRRNLGAAEMHLARALTAFDAAGYETPPGSLLNSLALLKIEVGDLAAAKDYLDRALDAFELIGADRATAAVLRNLADVSERIGQWREADEHLQRSLTLRRELNDARGEMSSLEGLAILRIKQGRFADAAQFASALRQAAEKSEDALWIGDAEAISGEIALLRDDLTAAEEHAAAAVAAFAEMNKKGKELTARSIALVVAHRRAPAPRHQQELKQAADWARADEQPARASFLEERRADLSLADGDVAAAAERLERAIEAARDATAPATLGRVSARLGHLRLDKGEADAAAALLGVAQQNAPRHYQTIALSARLAAKNGRAEEAATLFEKAKAAAGDHWRHDRTAHWRIQ